MTIPDNTQLCTPQRQVQTPVVRIRDRRPKPKMFAGEQDPPKKWVSKRMAMDKICGCTTYFPNTKNVFGLNFQQTLKTAELAYEMHNQNRKLMNQRSLPPRLIDDWGNMKKSDMTTIQKVANMYLSTLHNTNDIDMEAGVGRPKRFVPPLERRASTPCVFTRRKTVPAPPRVVGYTGHIPNTRHLMGVDFNKVQMNSDKNYAKAVTANADPRLPLN